MQIQRISFINNLQKIPLVNAKNIKPQNTLNTSFQGNITKIRARGDNYVFDFLGLDEEELKEAQNICELGLSLQHKKTDNNVSYENTLRQAREKYKNQIELTQRVYGTSGYINSIKYPSGVILEFEQKSIHNDGVLIREIMPDNTKIEYKKYSHFVSRIDFPKNKTAICFVNQITPSYILLSSGKELLLGRDFYFGFNKGSTFWCAPNTTPERVKERMKEYV